MFSGIIKAIGIVKEIQPEGEGKKLLISSNLNLENIQIGDSVAISGCCLTVIHKEKGTLGFYISADTLEKTTLIGLQPNSKVNMEPSLRMCDALGGHFVTGHVDSTARIVGVTSIGIDHRIEIEINKYGKKLLIQRGSITLDGISLTVAYLSGNIVVLNIIPHTWENTTMKYLNATANYLVNIEYDPIAKHTYKFVKNLIVR